MSDIGMDLYIAYEDGYKAGYAEAERKKKCKPQTNADRIRSMTDEELAKLMVASCAEHMTIETCKLHEKCYECWLEWLKQEAEDASKQ